MTESVVTADPWCALDFAVDAAALVADLDVALTWAPQAEASVDQQVRRRESSEWSVVSLRGPYGDPRRTDPGLPGEPYAGTPALDDLPAFGALLAALPCETMSARLMRLAAGARIDPHHDPFFGFDYGKVRLHVAVVTSEKAVITFGDAPAHWSPGHLWYGDFSGVHSVWNGGQDDRIHLVLDCVLNPGLLALFPPSHRPAGAMVNRPPLDPPPPHGFEPGRWRLTVAKRALDWTEGAAPGLDDPVDLDLVAGERPEDLSLTMPSGVAAPLRAVGGGSFRVGAMPEETMVRLGAGSAEIVRRVGADQSVFHCAVAPL